jgi:hypothetical protein
MSDRCYCLYGMCFASHWCLPYEEAPLGRCPEVRLVEDSPKFFARAALEAGWPPANADWFHQRRLEDGSVYLRWSRHFEFVVSPGGRRIAGRSLSTTSAEAFHTYLLGHVLSYALLRRGVDPLHGTVVVVGGAGIAFLGDCGYGKSSIAASFIEAGHRLLTDDLLVLRSSVDGLAAFPGPPRIKLSPKMARAFLESQSGGVPMNQFTPKLVVPLRTDQIHQTPVPLTAIYLLTPPAKRTRTARVTIRPVSQRKSFVELLRNTFNAQVRETDRLERQFRQASRIVAAVPVKSLSYRRHTSILPAVRNAVLADLGH